MEERGDERMLQPKRDPRAGKHAHGVMSLPSLRHCALHTRAAQLPLERDQGVVHDQLLRLRRLGPGVRAGQRATHRHVEAPQHIGGGGQRSFRGKGLEVLLLKNTLHGSKGSTGASAGAENTRMMRAHTNETTRVGAHWSTDDGSQ